MISLEQLRQLDVRVKKAVTAVRSLALDNADLKRQIAVLEVQLESLRREASDRKADDQKLEVSLQGVLDVLDGMEEGPSGVGSVPQERRLAVEEVPGPEKADTPAQIRFSTESFDTDVDEDEPDDSEEVSGDTDSSVLFGNDPHEPKGLGFDDEDTGAVEEEEPAEDVPEEAESDDVTEIPEDVHLDEDEDEDEDETSNRDNKVQSEFDIF